ncbi:MAG: hypothetical protein ACH350_09855 [Parachlamydiaceae bacterium]
MLQKKENQDTSFLIDVERLNQYSEFSSFHHEERDNIILFIQWAYNLHSPLTKEYESLEERRMAAKRMVIVGEDSFIHNLTHIDRNGKSMYTSEMLSVLEGVEEMIFCYVCLLQNNNDFTAYITFQRLFWQYQRQLLEEVKGEDIGGDKVMNATNTKSKIRADFMALISDIEKYRVKLFGENESVAKKADQKIRNTMRRPENLKS